MSKEQTKEFEEAAKPLIKWMAENLHPHHVAIVENTGAQLLEGKAIARVVDYIKD